MTGGRSPSWLAALLACPLCHGPLESESAAFSCGHCHHSFPDLQGSQRIDFLPQEVRRELTEIGWETRHAFFRKWLIAAAQNPSSLGDEDFFAACVRRAGRLAGLVLDIGGGDGYLRRWLPPDVHYVCIDPEPYPSQCAARASGREGVADVTDPVILRGVGEYLPFQQEAFRTVFCLATLNHTAHPPQVLQGIDRVLQPGGTLMLTLEEVPPLLPLLHLANWRAIRAGMGTTRARWRNSLFSRGKPDAQPDHIPVPHRMIGKWLGGNFQIQETFFLASRGVIEMGQRWQKKESVRK
jgi:SAM-dependent methyltransferase